MTPLARFDQRARRTLSDLYAGRLAPQAAEHLLTGYLLQYEWEASS